MPLTPPGMAPVADGLRVPHREIDVGRGDGAGEHAEVSLVVAEPDVVVGRDLAERRLRPVLAREDQRRTGDVPVVGTSDQPVRDVEEPERRQERHRRAADRRRWAAEPRHHRLHVAGPVPVVVVHLHADRSARRLAAEVELRAEQRRRIEPQQAPADAFDGLGFDRVVLAVVDDDQLSPGVGLPPVPLERERQQPRSIPRRQDYRDERGVPHLSGTQWALLLSAKDSASPLNSWVTQNVCSGHVNSRHALLFGPNS